MANRLVSVDDNLHLPPEVLTQLTADVRTEFNTSLSQAQSAASSATSSATAASNSASSASSSASTASAAAAQATAIVTGDLDPANAVLIDDAGSATREALDEHYMAADSAPTNVVNLTGAGIPTDGSNAASALNTLIGTLAPGSVLIGDPNSTYTLSGTVVLNKSITLRDIRFHTENYTGVAIRVISSNVTLDNVTINGDTNVGTPVTTNYFVHVDGTSTTRRDNVRILNCTMSNNRGTFIWAEWCTNFTFSGNTLLNGQYAGIMVVSGQWGHITGNTVRSLLMTAPLVNAYGIACTDMDNTSAARSAHIIVSENFIEDVTAWAGIDTHSGEDISIVNNTTWNCWVGINVVPGNSERLFAPKDCVVANNTVVRIDTAAQNAGIVFSGRATGSLLASGYFGGNIIRGYTTPYVTVAIDPSNFRTDGKPLAYGSSTTSVAASGGNAQITVTYPAGLFTAAPFVAVTVSSARVNASVANNTATGCTLSLNNWTTAAANGITVEWRAEER